MIARAATPADLGPLTDLFLRRWHDAHTACSPPGLIAIRTREDCATRLRSFFAAGDLWVVGPVGATTDFVALEGHHVNQL